MPLPVVSQELYIQGYAAEIFTDDATALHLHAESHMIRWRGEVSPAKLFIVTFWL